MWTEKEEAGLALVPVFPLPEIALFPGGKLALHIFEPRYRAMLADALAGARLISVVRITDRNELDESGHPEIASIAGIGRIVTAESLPDGRANIVLSGVARVHLHELPFVPPYRRARALPIIPVEVRVGEADRLALLSSVTSFLREVRKHDESFDPNLELDAPPEVLVDEIAQQLLVSPIAKQEALEELDLSARIALVLRELAVQRRTLALSDTVETFSN